MHEDDADFIYLLTEDILKFMNAAFSAFLPPLEIEHFGALDILLNKILELQGKICFESVTHSSLLFVLSNKIYRKNFISNPYSIVVQRSFFNLMPKSVYMFFDKGNYISSFLSSVTLKFLYHIYFTLIIRIITKVSKLNILIGIFDEKFFFDITDLTILNSIYSIAYNEIILDKFFLKKFIDYNYYLAQAFAE